MLRHKIVQYLGTGPMAYSTIEGLCRREEDEVNVQDPLRQVGKLTPSKKDPSKKVFELNKGELWRNFYLPMPYFCKATYFFMDFRILLRLKDRS